MVLFNKDAEVKYELLKMTRAQRFFCVRVAGFSAAKDLTRVTVHFGLVGPLGSANRLISYSVHAIKLNRTKSILRMLIVGPLNVKMQKNNTIHVRVQCA